MAVPTAESVEERVVQNVQDVLAAISPTSTEASYWTAVRRVHVMDRHPLDLPELPAVVVLYENSREDWYDAAALVVCELYFQIYCVLSYESATWKRDIKRFAADVKTALRLDTGRGTFDDGANAFDTTILAVDVANQPDGHPVAVARIDAQVTYRHLTHDPTTAA